MPQLCNNWIIFLMISIFFIYSLEMTPKIDCHRVVAVPKILVLIV